MGLNNSTDQYYLEIALAGWTFSIWGLIYAYQLIWLVYAITTLFRKPKFGNYLYVNPYMSPFLYIMLKLSTAGYVVCLLLFDVDYLWQALIVLVLLQVTLSICIFISARDLVNNGQALIDMGQGKAVHNAWGMYAAWCTIATLLNLGIVLSYVFHLLQETSSSICLCVLILEVIVFFVMDNIVFERYTRYLITPYIVPHVAFVGILCKTSNPLLSNFYITVTFLVFIIILTCTKIWPMVWRLMNRPVFAKDKSDGEPLHYMSNNM